MKVSAVLTALLAATAATARPTMRKREVLNTLDFEIVNLAWNLEALELNLWNQGLTNFTAADFTAAGLPANFRTELELLRNQEIAHTSLLAQTLERPLTNCTYNFPVYNARDLLSVGQIVTSVGIGAYVGALPNITSPAVRETAGRILGNEARQNSLLRERSFLNFFSAPNFETPLTASQAFSLASQYWNCPVASNPPFNLSSIPPLNLTFANPNATVDHRPGEVITVTWNASQAFLGQDVHLTFLSDLFSVIVPLNQTVVARNGTGRGTTVLPPNMNGTVFAVATTYNASGPIPDAFNYGIGALVVA